MKMTLQRGVAAQKAFQISKTARVDNVGQTLRHREVKSDSKHKARAAQHDGKWERIIAALLVSFMHHNASNLRPGEASLLRTLKIQHTRSCTHVSFLSRVKMELKSDNCRDKNKLERWLYFYPFSCVVLTLSVTAGATHLSESSGFRGRRSFHVRDFFCLSVPGDGDHVVHSAALWSNANETL